MTVDPVRPDVSDEEIGIRTFHVRKARAAERATARLRQAIGTAAYGRLGAEDVERLELLLGELYVHVGSEAWEHLHFGGLQFEGVQQLVAYADELIRHARSQRNILDDAWRVVGKGPASGT